MARLGTRFGGSSFVRRRVASFVESTITFDDSIDRTIRASSCDTRPRGIRIIAAGKSSPVRA